MDKNFKCIRAIADLEQIKRCRREIDTISDQITLYSKFLDLAGNEARLKILYLLDKEKEICVCDISDILQMKIPAISQHIRKMKDGGILTFRKDGQTIYYSIAEDYADKLTVLLENLSMQKV